MVPPLDLDHRIRLAREAWGVYPTKLPDVCRYLGIPLRHHDAASDAEACARIVIAAEARDMPAQPAGRRRPHARRPS